MSKLRPKEKLGITQEEKFSRCVWVEECMQRCAGGENRRMTYCRHHGSWEYVKGTVRTWTQGQGAYSVTFQRHLKHHQHLLHLYCQVITTRSNNLVIELVAPTCLSIHLPRKWLWGEHGLASSGLFDISKEKHIICNNSLDNVKFHSQV